LCKEYDAYALKQDQNIEQQGVVLDVIQIELELADGILDRGAISIEDLCPPGNTGL
jgi:hypothetical protein